MKIRENELKLLPLLTSLWMVYWEVEIEKSLDLRNDMVAFPLSRFVLWLFLDCRFMQGCAST